MINLFIFICWVFLFVDVKRNFQLISNRFSCCSQISISIFYPIECENPLWEIEGSWPHDLHKSKSSEFICGLILFWKMDLLFQINKQVYWWQKIIFIDSCPQRCYPAKTNVYFFVFFLCVLFLFYVPYCCHVLCFSCLNRLNSRTKVFADENKTKNLS